MVEVRGVEPLFEAILPPNLHPAISLENPRWIGIQLIAKSVGTFSSSLPADCLSSLRFSLWVSHLLSMHSWRIRRSAVLRCPAWSCDACDFRNRQDIEYGLGGDDDAASWLRFVQRLTFRYNPSCLQRA